MTRKTTQISEIDVAPRPFKAPQEHVRTALHLLSELDERLDGTGSMTGERYYVARLLAAARRQLWLAAAVLDSGVERSGWGVQHRRARRNRGWVLRIALKVVTWGALVLGFVIACAWRCTRAVLRMLLRN
jgi:hypothetical protein